MVNLLMRPAHRRATRRRCPLASTISRGASSVNREGSSPTTRTGTNAVRGCGLLTVAACALMNEFSASSRVDREYSSEQSHRVGQASGAIYKMPVPKDYASSRIHELFAKPVQIRPSTDVTILRLRHGAWRHTDLYGLNLHSNYLVRLHGILLDWDPSEIPNNGPRLSRHARTPFVGRQQHG